MLRQGAIDPKFLYEVSEHKIGKFTKIRESQKIINYLLQQTLQNSVILTKNNGFYVLACFSTLSDSRIMIDTSFDCA